jgi:polyphosphate kinase
MNALEDVDITKALYQAAQAGVKIDLIIRDTCRLRPGIAGLSDKVRVISIVGRFLEHSRIFYFQNGGEEEYFIGSADCMKRNLESRVEVVTPVQKLELQASLRQILNVQLTNQRSVWEMQADGRYIQLQPKDKQLGAQETLIKFANNRFDEAKASKSHKKTKNKQRANRNTD